MNLKDFSDALERASQDTKRKQVAQAQLYSDRLAGKSVTHNSYLLVGEILGGEVVPMSNSAMLVVKWDTGAVTNEFPATITLTDMTWEEFWNSTK